MAKIDDVIEAVSSGYQDVQVTCGMAWVPDEQIEALQVRRKKAGEPKHKLWYISISETGSQTPPAIFWGHRFTDALKKAMKWRGMETKSKRGPKKAANGQPTA